MPIRYFLIGCYTMITSKVLMIVLVICLALGIIQISSGYREELIIDLFDNF